MCSIAACKSEQVEFSNVPLIELESVEQLKNVDGKDSIIKVSLYYQDGDGDIGLTETDTSAPFNLGSPFFHNLPVTYLVPNGMGEYKEFVNPSTNRPYGNQHERVPYLTPSGKYKSISGTIDVFLSANPALANPDSLKFEIKLMDRDLNVSNTVTTEVIELTH